jgi:hypothetical protein
MNGRSAQGNRAMTKLSEKELQKKREKIQVHFWNQVGAVEHVSLPMLEDAVRKEFRCEDDRFVQEQIRLMQSEARIRLESRVKVWIKQPSTWQGSDGGAARI